MAITQEFTGTAREAITRSFDLVEFWLSTAPTGYEFHDPYDGSITTLGDAQEALDALRVLVLDESTMVVG